MADFPIPAPIVTEIESVPAEGYAPFYFGADGDVLLFRFTDASFTRVLSALRNGAYYSYNEEGTQVIWDFLQNVEYPMPFCEQIINCVLNDQGTRSAIATAIASDPEMRRAVQLASIAGSPMSDAVVSEGITQGCELDILFAQIRGIVDQMDTNNRDFLEIIALANTPGKRLAAVIKAIPILETLPIDDVIEFVSKVYDEILTNYNAEWTTSVRDDISCGLFCIAKDQVDCELDYQNLQDYFEQRIGHALDPVNFALSAIQYAALGTWSGTTIVDIMMLVQVGVWRQAGEWLGLNLRSLAAVTQLSGNIPDSDWEILCTDCPPPLENCLDLVAGDQGVLPAFTNSAQYTAGHGFAQEIAGGMSLRFQDTAIPDEITSFDITWFRDWDGGTPNPDYDKYYGQVDSPSGTAGTVYWGQGADPLRMGDTLHIEAPAGTHWNKSDMVITNIGGGNTWPQNAPQSTGPQYMAQICFNN